MVDDDFFTRSEAAHPFCRFRRDNFLRRIGAAYDLRSGFLHSGTAFGAWIAPLGSDNEEIRSGRPVVSDRNFARVLAASPTYIGLERLIRYVLLRFGERSGLIAGDAA